MRYQQLTRVCVAASLTLFAVSPAFGQSDWQTKQTQSLWDPKTAELAPLEGPAQLDWRVRETDWHARDTKSLSNLQATQSAALKWELGYLFLSAIDTAQTVECLQRKVCQEVNPLFGKHPSTKTLILAKLAGGVSHFALFSYINHRNPKMALRAAQVSFALQGTVVMLNARITFK